MGFINVQQSNTHGVIELYRIEQVFRFNSSNSPKLPELSTYAPFAFLLNPCTHFLLGDKEDCWNLVQRLKYRKISADQAAFEEEMGR